MLKNASTDINEHANAEKCEAMSIPNIDKRCYYRYK